MNRRIVKRPATNYRGTKRPLTGDNVEGDGCRAGVGRLTGVVPAVSLGYLGDPQFTLAQTVHHSYLQGGQKKADGDSREASG